VPASLSTFTEKGLTVAKLIHLDDAKERIAQRKKRKLLMLGYPRLTDPDGHEHVLVAFILERHAGRIMYCFDIAESEEDTLFSGYIESPYYTGFGEIHLSDIDLSTTDIILSPADLQRETFPPPGWSD